MAAAIQFELKHRPDSFEIGIWSFCEESSVNSLMSKLKDLFAFLGITYTLSHNIFECHALVESNGHLVETEFCINVFSSDKGILVDFHNIGNYYAFEILIDRIALFLKITFDQVGNHPRKIGSPPPVDLPELPLVETIVVDVFPAFGPPMLSVLPQSSVYDPIEGLIPASEFTTEIP
jgi:hypothetical protein